MNILFMIGNGFDVGVGLKTKFDDFLPYYVDKVKSHDKAIIKFKEDIVRDGYETWADFEKKLGLYTQDFNIDTKEDFFTCRDDFVDELINYLREEEKNARFTGAGSIIDVFVDSLTGFHKKNRLLEGSAVSIAQAFAQHRNFRHHYNFITFNYTNVLTSCVNILRKLSSPITHNTSSGRVADMITEPLHIHGTLDDGVLIGVNDESAIAQDVFSVDPDFASRFVKPGMNALLKNTKHEKGAELVNSSDIICVFGMSMGETDATWWQLIANWLLENNGRQLVLWDYVPSYSRANPANTIKHNQRVANRFFDIVDMTGEERRLVEDQVHVGINSGGENDLFKITLADKH